MADPVHLTLQSDTFSKDSEDLEIVDRLCQEHQKEKALPPKGDPRRPILQRKIIESKQQIEMGIKEKALKRSRQYRQENFRNGQILNSTSEYAE